MQPACLNADELVFVKAQLQHHDEPFAPTEPPTCKDWDATQVEGTLDEGRGEIYGPFLEDSPEAPLAEEIPEVPRIRPEELMSHEVEGQFQRAEGRDEHPPAEHENGATQAFKAMRKHTKPIVFPHAKLTWTEVSGANATYGTPCSPEEEAAASTEAPLTDDILEEGDALVDWDEDDDQFVVGPTTQINKHYADSDKEVDGDAE